MVSLVYEGHLAPRVSRRVNGEAVTGSPALWLGVQPGYNMGPRPRPGVSHFASSNLVPAARDLYLSVNGDRFRLHG